jgi:hypothetical protein
VAVRDAVLKILSSDMGPAAGAFLDRQCKSRLQKDAAALTKGDLDTLAKWVEVGAALVLSEPVAKKMAVQIRAIK